MKTAVEFGVVAFSSVFAMVDPIATAPLFVDMTKKFVPQRRRIALRACIAAGVTLILFAVAGSAIFSLFGITVPAFQIVGGLLLSISAMKTLHGVEEKEAESEGDDPSIVPLGIPLIAGAGSISTVMVLAGQAREKTHQIALSVAILVAIAISLVVFWLAPSLVSKLGKGGQQIMSRVMALLSAVIGVQFIINGATTVIGNLLAR